jgi:hypothetical protein
MSDPLKDLGALLDAVEPSAAFAAQTEARIAVERGRRVPAWRWWLGAAAAGMIGVAGVMLATRTTEPASVTPQLASIVPAETTPAIVNATPRHTEASPRVRPASARPPRPAARAQAAAAGALVPATWNERPGFVAPIEPISAIEPIGDIAPIELKPLSLEPIPQIARIGGGER